MARSLYDRVANRGFPSFATDGITGAGQLDSQGHPVDPSHGNLGEFPGLSPYRLPMAQRSGQEPPAPPQDPVLEGTWGLAGDLHDDTDSNGQPDYYQFSAVNGNNSGGIGLRSHAAPFSPGWAGDAKGPSDDLAAMHANAQEIHSPDPWPARAHWRIARDAIDESQQEWRTETEANDPGEAVGLVQLEGAARGIGRQGDAVQGYDLRNRYGFDAGHRHRIRPSGNVVNAYLDPGERTFVVPQGAGSFTPSDAVQGPEPWSSFRHGDGINYSPPTDYTPPSTSENTISDGQLTAASASTGWGW